ncbi:MAG: CopD family protein [Cyanobacteria bacterium NC_groundwater_1444_Ag_S-0.65um_54_12]|nr:CopD family protein [Cyanobacteria bacterium NC_groundwater_1444_Ag_S-0.65um_54_12]
MTALTLWLTTQLLWIKALHVLTIISWMAGLLYLFRLFIYHAMETEAVTKERFVVMERRLYRYITEPAQWGAWIFGAILVWLQPYLWSQRWFYVKLAGVVLLTCVHYLAPVLMARLLKGLPVPHDKALRVLNEIPTVLMIVIVIMVVVRPW